jgi:alkanesulfonate monooxygenase
MSSNPAVAADPIRHPTPAFQLFSTCPSSLTSPDNYLERVVQVARWSENAGCAGSLIYTDNTLVDPWLVAQVVIQNTKNLAPLVAVQPVYIHPYEAAKIIATLGFLHNRRVFLNMVAGGFKNDLVSLSDTVPHDKRYQRLIEYTTIVQKLLSSGAPVTFDGEFYKVSNATFTPHLSADLLPEILVSGSSEAGMAAAREMRATAVKYPEPPAQCKSAIDEDIPCGVRIGIIARKNRDAAWSVAQERFPEDRKGQLTRQLANKVSDSAWHKRLAEVGAAVNGLRDTYWLHPFENYQTNCPYLVGSYDEVAFELHRYISVGYGTFILDIPFSEEEFEHIGAVFQLASRSAAA